MSGASGQHSILVVDDTPANIGILLDTLSKAGYRVRVASDGESALEQLQYSPPDLVLLDVMMPGMDGFETCRRLRQLPKLEQLPVVFMTALSDTQDKVRAFAAGADDYITKPFQHEEVLEGLADVIIRARSERADFVLDFGQRSHEDDRQLLEPGQSAQATAGLEAVHPRHHDVEQHQSGR